MNYANRAIEPAQDRIAVKLNEGWNKLMVKVVDQEGGWPVGLRFTDQDGLPLEGIKVEPLGCKPLSQERFTSFYSAYSEPGQLAEAFSYHHSLSKHLFLFCSPITAIKLYKQTDVWQRYCGFEDHHTVGLASLFKDAK